MYLSNLGRVTSPWYVVLHDNQRHLNTFPQFNRFVPQSRRMGYNEDTARVGDLYVRAPGLIGIINSGDDNRARNLTNNAWTTVPKWPSVVGSSPNDFLFRHFVTFCYVHAQLISIQFYNRITWHINILPCPHSEISQQYLWSKHMAVRTKTGGRDELPLFTDDVS